MRVVILIGNPSDKRYSMQDCASSLLSLYELFGHTSSIYYLSFFSSHLRVVKVFDRYFIAPLLALFINADFVHLVDHAYGHVLPFIRAKKIITVHDLIPLSPLASPVIPLHTRWLFFLSVYLGILSADFITVVSNYTRLSLLNHFNLSKFIHLTHNILARPELSISKSHKSFDILISGNSFYKNHDYSAGVLSSFPSPLNIALLNPSEFVCQILQKSKHNITIFRDLSSIIPLYESSFLSINLSLIEGYGLTPFEAACHNCCPIISRIPIFEELHPSSLSSMVSLDDSQQLLNEVFKLLSEPFYLKCRLSNVLYDFQSQLYTKNSFSSFISSLPVLQ